ncbi:hypothetical protein LTR56_020104 [Elasticomyces elasticus]|nr:hypothetical protein LTR56_020104 [Elasticomyces elasticus]KAK4910975.1 hypothetical protein LTR49_020420 [Elasticomyces elasticus]KAK5761019.1 hypothetical protein LTS12_008867 [Elasticomyces elasticus]
MAIKNRPPGLRYILLLLLFIFGTQVYSQEFSQDLGGYDLHAVNNSSLGTLREFAKRQDDLQNGSSCCLTTDVGSYWTTLQKRGSPLVFQRAPSPQDVAFLVAISKKGGERRSKLLCNNPDPSPFAADTAPYDNGWIARFTQGLRDRDPAIAPEKSKPLDAVAQTILAAGIEGNPPVPIASGPSAMPYYEWVHSRQDWFYTNFIYGNIPSGIFSLFGPTGAIYASFMNPKAGLILCVNNYGPDWKIKQAAAKVPPQVIGPAPPMKQLSDILFFQWKMACAKHPDGNNVVSSPLTRLKYIFQRGIADAETIRVVDVITSIPNQGIIAWPGRYYSFTQDNEPNDMKKSFAFALLGTPQGASVSFLLLQHSDDLGLKVPKGVRVFGTPGDRNMMFYLETPDQNSADLTPPGEQQLR